MLSFTSSRSPMYCISSSSISPSTTTPPPQAEVFPPALLAELPCTRLTSAVSTSATLTTVSSSTAITTPQEPEAVPHPTPPAEVSHQASLQIKFSPTPTAALSYPEAPLARSTKQPVTPAASVTRAVLTSGATIPETQTQKSDKCLFNIAGQRIQQKQS